MGFIAPARILGTGGHLGQVMWVAYPPRVQPRVYGQGVFCCAARGKKLAEMCQHFEPHANQILERKEQLLANTAGVFGSASKELEPFDLRLLHK